MAAGGRPHDADALRIDLPLRGFGAGEADAARGIVQHGGMPVAFRAEPILQDDSGDSVIRQPLRIAPAFVIGEAAIAAARDR